MTHKNETRKSKGALYLNLKSHVIFVHDHHDHYQSLVPTMSRLVTRILFLYSHLMSSLLLV